MTAKKGYDYVLKQGTASGGTVIGGLRNTKFVVNNEMVDVTSKSTAGWRTLLESAGTKSVQITAEGVFNDDAAYDTVMGYAMNGTINTFGLVDGDGNTLEGSFQVSSLESSGAFNEAQMYSITLESSGTPTYTNV